MYKYLWEETNYTAEISYITNTFIYEYDISKCNINVLYSAGAINKSTYDYLYNAERMVRQVYIGKLQRDDPNITEVLNSGIKEARKKLFASNNIQERDVLSIKKDAVFIIGRQLRETKFGLIEFVLKNTYTAFYRINNLEFYYYYNNITKDERIDIKGISNEALAPHERYFLQILKDLMYSVQVNGPEITMNMLKDIYNEYITLQFPVEYYRKFNLQCNYHLRVKTFLNTGFESDTVSEASKPLLDITYNQSILTEFQRLLVSMYFSKHR